MSDNMIISNLIRRFAIYHGRNIIVIECSEKGILGLNIGLKLLNGGIGSCVFITIRNHKRLGNSLGNTTS